MMLSVMGTMRPTPAAPSAISSARAASGPYAAELSASSPNTGMPAAGPSLSPLSSDVLSGRPNKRSMTDMWASGRLSECHTGASRIIAEPESPNTTWVNREGTARYGNVVTGKFGLPIGHGGTLSHNDSIGQENLGLPMHENEGCRATTMCSYKVVVNPWGWFGSRISKILSAPHGPECSVLWRARLRWSSGTSCGDSIFPSIPSGCRAHRQFLLFSASPSPQMSWSDSAVRATGRRSCWESDSPSPE